MNKRLLILMASMFLCGAVSAQHFEADAHAHDNNMPVVAQVVLDGDAVTTGGYELGAFIGDDVRGSAQIQPTLGNTYWIQVYYSTDTEAAATVSFKLYDGEDEYTAETTLTVDPEGYGTPGTPQVIVVNRAVTQTTQLATGWTWWSTPIEMNGVDGLTMLENALGSNGVIIKNSTQSAVYYASLNRWMGNCPITNEGSYMIKVNNDCEIALTGTWANPENHPIQLKSNDWTWIGYPVNQTQTITTALADLQPEVGDVVKNGTTSAVYFSTNLGWRPANYTFTPGCGYMYKSNAASNKTFTYAYARGFEQTNLVDDLYWDADHNVVENNITILAKVYVEGEEQRNENLELGAFINGECRGNAKLIYIEQPFDAYYVIMNITGENGDMIDFKLFNAEDVTINTESKTHLVFRENDIIGEPSNPYIINFDGNSDLDNAVVEMFPNPVGRNQSFTINIPSCETIYMITITDILGNSVYQKINSEQLQLNGISVSGVYLVKVICESGKLYYGRIVVE